MLSGQHFEAFVRKLDFKHLLAAVCGNIFASPNPSQVLRGLELVQNPNGTVIIVKNYTGDILNFGLAKEKYSAKFPDQASKLRFVVVADDVAVGRTQGAIVGRRGLAGTVLVYKIAGALAKRGGSLDDVESLAKCVAAQVGTIGVGLGHCSVPGSTRDDTLKEDEYEVGMGIHNEPGYLRSSPVPSLNKLVVDMVNLLTDTTDSERSFLKFRLDTQDRVILLVNNLGGTSELELGAVAAAAVLELERRKMVIERVLVGTFMTSLNMPGFSLSLLLLPREEDKHTVSAEKILQYLDDETEATAWKAAIKVKHPGQRGRSTTGDTVAQASRIDRCMEAPDKSAFVALVERVCMSLKAAEPEITKMDEKAGDGDCGYTLKNGAEAIIKSIHEGRINGDNVIEDARAIAEAVEMAMDGTSGALYSIFFSALTQALYDQATPNTAAVSREMISKALNFALTRLYTYTRARPPSRTLVDPLDAFIKAITSGKSWKHATNEAARAAENTKNLPAKAGRAAYVDQSNLDVCDPGAWGVKVILEAACAGLEE
ncbi:Dihydroxyacetone kinase 2 Short=DHA kinase 2; AltName: Full=Glycerone kinase 2; AltName: Full=Triokinase 2; AltName: Full=Triose kinase 2 [Serendipita indica DSM 11827]|nr:Dihydroxyacetone kinase 2 Short=DHA kinase 2; AltName: Full=Glycerone kinase 2; AltName: Full=Triokinase 2; AltName: Full=Triose kinase 2 [Serendipita indica DSM 11827]